MVKIKRSRARYPQTGSAFIELAISLPLILLMMIGTAEVGSAFFRYNTLNKLTVTVARYLSDNGVLGSTGVLQLSDALRTEAENLLLYGKTTPGPHVLLPALAADDLVIDTPPGLPGHVRVRVTYDYPLMLGGLLSDLMTLSGESFPATITLSTAAVMEAP